MTTIACDGRTIAADGLVTSNGLIHDRTVRKVFKLDDGSIVGLAGSVYYLDQTVDFLNGKRDKIDFGDEFEGIILRPDGTCLCLDGDGRTYRQSTPCATGSGTPMALAAMLAGKSAFDAVRIACEIDMSSGGEVIELQPTCAESLKAV